MTRLFTRVATCLAAFSALAPLSAAEAQTYPARPVRIIVPFAPGGGADTLLKIGGQHSLVMQHSADFKEVDVNPMIVSDCGAVAVNARFILA